MNSSCVPKSRAPSILPIISAPEFRIHSVHLNFALEPQATRVTATLKIERLSGTGPLMLAGENQKLLRLALDGQTLAPGAYMLDDKGLTIPNPPAKLTLEIESQIDPAANTELEGLFLSNGMFCTQCEPEGFRRITYFLDRPDNLSVFTVRIEADEGAVSGAAVQRQPRPKRRTAEGGRHFAVWHDPFPKPSYLFALVAGDLGSIHDSFTTMTGRSNRAGHLCRARQRAARPLCHGRAEARDDMGRRGLWPRI